MRAVLSDQLQHRCIVGHQCISATSHGCNIAEFDPLCSCSSQKSGGCHAENIQECRNNYSQTIQNLTSRAHQSTPLCHFLFNPHLFAGSSTFQVFLGCQTINQVHKFTDQKHTEHGKSSEISYVSC